MSNIKDDIRAILKSPSKSTVHTADIAIGMMSSTELYEKLTSIEFYVELKINEAKYSTVINSLNLLNTEPIHTVEQALLGDKEKLEALLDD